MLKNAVFSNNSFIYYPIELKLKQLIPYEPGMVLYNNKKKEQSRAAKVHSLDARNGPWECFDCGKVMSGKAGDWRTR